jgi:hypothetical protein
MNTRRACTSGGMRVSTSSGAQKNVPAGICWIGPQLSGGDVGVHWTEQGTEHSAAISAVQLRAYLCGCILQYS